MALGARPYRYKLVGRGTDANEATLLQVEILDATGARRGGTVVPDAGQDLELVEQAIRAAVQAQLEADAGGRIALWDQIIAGGGML